MQWGPCCGTKDDVVQWAILQWEHPCKHCFQSWLFHLWSTSLLSQGRQGEMVGGLELLGSWFSLAQFLHLLPCRERTNRWQINFCICLCNFQKPSQLLKKINKGKATKTKAIVMSVKKKKIQFAGLCWFVSNLSYDLVVWRRGNLGQTFDTTIEARLVMLVFHTGIPGTNPGFAPGANYLRTR